MYLGSWKIDDYLTFPVRTYTGNHVPIDADAVPSYRIYEDETATPIVTGTMAKLDDANTVGFYSERIQLTAASGFEKGKCYTIYIAFEISEQTYNEVHVLQIEAEVDANSGADNLNVQPLIPPSIDLANTAAWRLGLMLTNALDDLPSTAEIAPGTLSIDRKGIGDTSWTTVIGDVACSEAAGLVYYDEVFDAASGYKEGDSIRVTFEGQKITVAAHDYEISDATGRSFYTQIRQSVRAEGQADALAFLMAHGSAAKILHLQLNDTRSDKAGDGLTGVLYTDITAYYVRGGAATATQITLANIPTLGTYVSGGFKEFDATNLPGVYEFHVPNACLVAGADHVLIQLKGADNMAPVEIKIQLTALNLDDSTRAGLTALPNVDVDADGSLATTDGNNRIAGIQGTKHVLDDLNDLNAAAVQAEVDTALATARLDELISATAGGVKPEVDSIVDLLMNKNASRTFDRATDSLEGQVDVWGGETPPTPTQIADAVLDRDLGAGPGQLNTARESLKAARAHAKGTRRADSASSPTQEEVLDWDRASVLFTRDLVPVGGNTYSEFREPGDIIRMPGPGELVLEGFGATPVVVGA